MDNMIKSELCQYYNWTGKNGWKTDGIKKKAFSQNRHISEVIISKSNKPVELFTMLFCL